MLHYPPDRQMMVMLAEGEHDQQTGQAVQKLREIAGEADFEAVEFIGPSRAGIAKAKDLYRYTMYMKHQDIKELMRLRDFLEGYLKWSQQFSNILLLIYVSHRRRFVTAQRMTNEAVKKEC